MSPVSPINTTTSTSTTTTPLSPPSLIEHSSHPLSTSISNNSITSDSSLDSNTSTSSTTITTTNYGTKTPSGNARIFNCTLCQRAFTREEHLTRHTLSTHNKLKPFTCGICSRPFSRRDLLLRHAKIYIKEVKLPSVGLERAINTATKIMTVKVVPIPILIRPIRMVRNKNRKMTRKKD